MTNQFYRLKVLAVENPIQEATTLTLAVPPHLEQAFAYFPGQHLIFQFYINGQEVRRSYSLNSCPFQEKSLQITAKRVKKGLVSNYIGDHVKVGDEVTVMVPQGRFFVDINKDDYKTYFLFAAGSGITPIISILKSVLLASPNSVVNLFYGNTHQDSIIFEEELALLQKQHPDRLEIVHTLSDPKVWSTWKQWTGRKGRIDAEAVEWFINTYPPVAQNTEYYICGPGAMNTTIRDTLIGLDVPKELVHIEQFGGNSETSNTAIKAVDQAQLTAKVNGQKYQITIPKGKTVLQALKDVKADPPYSCESGVCGTCVARVTSGEVEMKSCMALEEKEIQKGMVLTCQALPVSKSVTLQFD